MIPLRLLAAALDSTYVPPPPSAAGTLPIASPACRRAINAVVYSGLDTPRGLTRAHLDQPTIFHTARIPRELLETRLTPYLRPQLSQAITMLEVPALALGVQVGVHGVASTLHTGV
jgi:hypothetical protein